MQSIKLGSRIKSAAILRADVAENCLGRAVLLDKNPSVKQIAFDSNLRRAVEVTQEDCIRFRLNPRPTYYFLIARLNTDMKGNVIGKDFVVEYLQMAESLYSDFCQQVDEMGKFTSITLNKVKKGQFSYLNVKPSNKTVLDDTLKAAITELRKNKEMIASMWQMVDLNTSITIEEYQKLLMDSDNQSTNRAPQQLPPTPAPKQLAQQSQDLDEGDDFDDDEPAPIEVPAQEVTADASDTADHSAEEFAGMGDDDFGDFN